MAQPAPKDPYGQRGNQDSAPLPRPQLRGLEGGGGGGEGRPGYTGPTGVVPSPAPQEGVDNPDSGGQPRHLSAVPDAPQTDDKSSLWNPDDIRGREQFDDPDSRYNGGPGIYNPEGDNNARGRRRKKASEGKYGLVGVLDRHKKLSVLIAALTTGTVSMAMLLSFSPFGLINFLKNIEAKGFQRYQVNMEGRSSKWFQAYMAMRLSEIDDPNIAPKDRQPIIFRSERVDNNKYTKDWYRTLRTSKFEQDVFEKYGIRFASIAYRDGNIIKFRPAKIIVNGAEETIFDPADRNYRTLESLSQDQIDDLNGRLSGIVYDNDKQARKAIKLVIKEKYPQWWKAIKRWHLRKDIQNMTGVRSWRFFEQTRHNFDEKRISVRNKIIVRSTPEDSKTGNFVRCFFGVPDCRSTTDAAHPKGRQHTPTGTNKETKTATDPNDPDAPAVPVDDGTAEPALKEGAAAGETSRKFVASLVSKATPLSMVDLLARFDKAMFNGSLSKLVKHAKAQHAIALFTTFAIAADQLTTGELSAAEANAFMEQSAHLTRSEGWSNVVSGKDLTPAQIKEKEAFCSEKHQLEMAQPENREEAEAEFQYLCDKDKVGNSPEGLQKAWTNGPGAILHPFLAAFNSTIGGFFDILDKVFGAVTGAVLTTVGLSDDVEKIAASGLEQAVRFAGAAPRLTDTSPSGQFANDGIQGAAALAESTARFQGAAATTESARALAEKNYVAYEAEKRESSSLATRYLALSNHESLLSKQLFALSTTDFSGFLSRAATTVFGNALTSPFAILSKPAHAATGSGYRAANFAGVDTYDMPAECLNSDPLTMTPQSATNADEMGIFAPEELTWDLLTSKDGWYDALYEKVGDDEDRAMKVWNCAIFDDTVRGGIGARYGYKGVNAYKSAGTQADAPDPTPSSISGDFQQLAKELIASGKLTDEDGRYMAQIKAISEGSFECNVNPIILKMLYGVIVKEGHTIQMISLNRKCTGVLTESREGSYHYRDGGGHAIDIKKFDGAATPGSGAATVKYLEAASKYLPKGTGYGQVVSCNSGFKIPEGSKPIKDSCDHQHIQVPVAQISR